MPDISMILQTMARFLVPGIFVLLLVLESIRPLRRLKRGRGWRYVVNGALTGLGFLAGVLAVQPADLAGALWVQ
jgi:4-hydroxybenzoate polyprenyltransferase